MARDDMTDPLPDENFDEKFARAMQKMDEQARNLDQVTAAVMNRFGESHRLHSCKILPQADREFRVYVFFRKNVGLERARRNESLPELEEFVVDELVRIGKGTKEELAVPFEFDSDENVHANYRGNYFLRMR